MSLFSFFQFCFSFLKRCSDNYSFDFLTTNTHPFQATHRLSESAERQGVSSHPARSPRTTDALVRAVALLRHATSVTTSGSQTAALTVLVHGVHDPVDRRVVADRVCLLYTSDAADEH